MIMIIFQNSVSIMFIVYFVDERVLVNCCIIIHSINSFMQHHTLIYHSYLQQHNKILEKSVLEP